MSSERGQDDQRERRLPDLPDLPVNRLLISRSALPDLLQRSSSRSRKASTSAPSRPTARRRSRPILISNESSATRPRPPDAEVLPFAPERFADPQARSAFVERLEQTATSPITCCALRRATARWSGSRSRANVQQPPDVCCLDPRCVRSEEARRSIPRSLPPAAAGREDGGARPDDLRRRARAEQPARDDSLVGRASRRTSRRRQGAPRPRRDPQRIRTRRAHRPQPADVCAQAPEHAHDGGRQRRDARNARAARRTSSASATSRVDADARAQSCRTSLPTRIRSSR